MEEIGESCIVENTPTSVVCVKSKEKSFSCTKCGKSFNCKGNLNRHYIVHTQEKPFTCSICKKSFKRKSHLVRHISAHAKEKLFLCSMCGMGFTRKDILNVHMRIHTNEKPFLCDKCDKSFKHSSSFRVHMRIHTHEKPYLCNMCDKSFKHNSGYRDHLKSHCDIKPYSCPLCDRGFKKASHVTSHMRVHTKEKPFKCMEYGQGCTMKSNHGKHLRTHTEYGESYHLKTVTAHKRLHSQERPYSCCACGEKFTRHDSLNKHMKIHNKGKRIGSQKNLNILNFTSSGNDGAPVICAVHDKCSENDDSSDAFKLVENDETSTSYVQALKHDPSDLFSSTLKKDDVANCLEESDFIDEFICCKKEEDEFISIKDEEILPEDELYIRNRKVNVLEGVDDTKGSSNCKILDPKPLNVDFFLVKKDILSDNEGEEKGAQDPLDGFIKKTTHKNQGIPSEEVLIKELSRKPNWVSFTITISKGFKYVPYKLNQWPTGTIVQPFRGGKQWPQPGYSTKYPKLQSYQSKQQRAYKTIPYLRDYRKRHDTNLSYRHPRTRDFYWSDGSYNPRHSPKHTNFGKARSCHGTYSNQRYPSNGRYRHQDPWANPRTHYNDEFPAESQSKQ
ncbi:hypothetical protein SK128_014146, partial [Halocaridina rubra]